MALIDTIIVFLVSLLIGAFGIYVGGRAIADVDDYTHALVTALIGAIIWAIVAFFLGGIPLLGPLLALLAYVAVINVRYPGEWLNAIAIAVVAWVAALIVLYILGVLGITAFDAIGVPGV